MKPHKDDDNDPPQNLAYSQVTKSARFDYFGIVQHCFSFGTNRCETGVPCSSAS